jgi:hypothetical protein
MLPSCEGRRSLGLLLPLLLVHFPVRRGLVLPTFVITFLFGLLGYRYLSRAREPAA